MRPRSYHRSAIKRRLRRYAGAVGRIQEDVDAIIAALLEVQDVDRAKGFSVLWHLLEEARALIERLEASL